ncbi:transcription termination factor NusA, partial [bacterium]|nr:transcription termination factor NusA [bacterium]
MRSDLMSALIQIEHDKGLKREVLILAIEEAILSAYRKKFGGSAKNVQVKLNPQTGEIKVFILRKVVALETKKEDEISLSEARTKIPNCKVDQEITTELAPQDFGRIAAQTAKQVIIQRIHEAERNLLYDEFSQKVGTIVTGVVQRTSPKGVFVDLGKIEGFLPSREQIAKEKYFVGDRIKAYILEIKKTTKTPSAVISRTHPGLIEKLFELEVPEIFDKVVEVKGIARDPGFRTKIAVSSNDGKIDPVGTCVGLRGVRVNAVVKELDGEKIDIIRFNEDIGTFIKNALTPAKVERVEIDDKKKRALVVAAKDQLSLAIGRK